MLACISSLSLLVACSGKEEEEWRPVHETWPPPCVAADDDDTQTRTFAIDSLVIPGTNTIGVNLDGLTTTHANDTVACGQLDGLPGGIDNALVRIVDAVNSLSGDAQPSPIEIDRQHAFDETGLLLTLSHWNGTANDNCVRVALSGSSGAGALSVYSNDFTMRDRTFPLLAFRGDLRIAPGLSVLGDGGMSRVPITLWGLRAHIVFDEAMTHVVTSQTLDNRGSSVLGGYVFYAGTETHALRPALESALASSASPLATELLAVIPTLLDLDSTPGPGLSACTSDGGVLSADSFSVGLLMTGHQIATP